MSGVTGMGCMSIVWLWGGGEVWLVTFVEY